MRIFWANYFCNIFAGGGGGKHKQILGDCPGTGWVANFCLRAFWGLLKFLVDVSDIFYFSVPGRGERKEASEEVAGGRFFCSKYREGGGGSEEDVREGEGRQGECLWGGGGGLNIFFRGRNAHQELRFWA